MKKTALILAAFFCLSAFATESPFDLSPMYSRLVSCRLDMKLDSKPKVGIETPMSFEIFLADSSVFSREVRALFTIHLGKPGVPDIEGYRGIVAGKAVLEKGAEPGECSVNATLDSGQMEFRVKNFARGKVTNGELVTKEARTPYQCYMAR